MATLAAVHIIIESAVTSNVLLVTFGEPRVGDPKFAQNIDGMIPLGHFTYRVVHGKDIVPALPPSQLFRGKPFQHHMTEVITNYQLLKISFAFNLVLYIFFYYSIFGR